MCIRDRTRAILIPHFSELKAACKEAGALGSGISGSGPSVFALSRGMPAANTVAKAMQSVLEKTNIPFDIHVSPVKKTGVNFIEDLLT